MSTRKRGSDILSASGALWNNMEIKTKYNNGDLVKIGRRVFRVKKIKADVGLRIFQFNIHDVKIKYSLEDVNGNWHEISQELIDGKAALSTWKKLKDNNK